MSSQGSGTRVFLSDVVVEIAVGHDEWEKCTGKKWPVRVDVEMFLVRAHWQGVTMKDIVDYTRVREYLDTWPARPHVELLEILAEDLIQFCFEDRQVSWVRVRLTKPNLFANDAVAGVEICRDRGMEHGNHAS